MPKTSFVYYTRDCEFPIENLPYGVFSTRDDTAPRIGVAIGDLILDLKKTSNIFTGPILIEKQHIFQQSDLNGLLSLDIQAWKEARKSLQDYLSADNPQNKERSTFVKQEDATMHMPVTIGDYTDFFSSYYHAYNCSKLFNMKILESNWSHVPIGYHGRASSIVVSGTPVKRPYGQVLQNGSQQPIFTATKKLDYELEVGALVGGSLNKLGEPIPIDEIENFIFGLVIVNDWSARDIQQWEMVPLGPFLSKNFATTISPWIVTMEALKPFLADNLEHDIPALKYLQHNNKYNFDINLDASLRTPDGTETKITKTNFKYMYWTIKQQICHHTITGCNLRPGDLFASGTISGPTEDSAGSLVELSYNGTKPVTLQNGQTRTFIENNDEIILTGYCTGDGYKIGFGKCAGKIQATN